jgi:anti-anti-sigma factor
MRGEIISAHHQGWNMKIESRTENGVLIVSIEGRMDAVSAPEFDKRCDEYLLQGRNAFILDFRALEYISSAGLRSILILGKKLAARKGTLLIASAKDVVKEIFQISGFGALFPILDSVDAALQKASGSTAT